MTCQTLLGNRSPSYKYGIQSRFTVHAYANENIRSTNIECVYFLYSLSLVQISVKAIKHWRVYIRKCHP